MDLTNAAFYNVTPVVFDGWRTTLTSKSRGLTEPNNSDWPYRQIKDRRQAIVDIIEAQGESLLDDEGVDLKVAGEMADEILAIPAAAPRIIVHVSGGLVSDVVGDAPFEYVVKDFDNIEAGDRFDVNPASAFDSGRLIDPAAMPAELEDELTEDQMDRN